MGSEMCIRDRVYLSDTGAAITLTLGTSGMTGTLLSAAVPGVYVGCTFTCHVIGTVTSAIAVSGTSGTASNGITPYGNLAGPTVSTSRQLTFRNSGANTWDVHVL